MWRNRSETSPRLVTGAARELWRCVPRCGWEGYGQIIKIMDNICKNVHKKNDLASYCHKMYFTF